MTTQSVLEHDFDLDLGARGTLWGRVTAPDDGAAHPAVVVCHGFKGFLEWGFFPPLAELLANRGFTVVRFNFRGSGMAPGDELVTDLEAFRDATFTGDLEDLLAVLRSLRDDVAPGLVAEGPVGLLGHSRGGGAALLAAAHDETMDRVGALVTWAAVSTFHRFPEEARDDWRRKGTVTIVNGRTGQELPLGLTVLEDLERHRGGLDLVAAAGRREAPWLLVHGEEDETVPIAEAELLTRAAADPVTLERLPGSGHTFDAQHPFAGPTPALVTAFNATQTWFRRHLLQAHD